VTWGAHFLDNIVAGNFIDAARGLAGLSWGNPATRAEMARRLAPKDRPDDALAMSAAQSNCAIACCAALYETGIDGLVRGFRGKPVCDPLREPRVRRYDAVIYLGVLADQTGTKRAPCAGADLLPGSWLLIGGGEAEGGPAHVVMVVGVRDDGTLDTVEGGKLDPGNPRTGAEGCTAIKADRREVVAGPGGSWWVQDVGGGSRRRRLIYWCWVGDLPTVPG